MCSVDSDLLWWFYPDGQPSTTTTTLSLLILIGKGGENMMDRSQGLQ